jgi:hypothetical protein
MDVLLMERGLAELRKKTEKLRKQKTVLFQSCHLLIFDSSWARVLATWFIRPELSGKRRLSCYFTLIIFREHQNGQNP